MNFFLCFFPANKLFSCSLWQFLKDFSSYFTLSLASPSSDCEAKERAVTYREAKARAITYRDALFFFSLFPPDLASQKQEQKPAARLRLGGGYYHGQ